MALPLLEGQLVDPHNAVEELREENARLKDELRAARQGCDKLRGELASITSSVSAIRDHLNPLHQALRGLFGEIDFVIPPNSHTQSHHPAASVNGSSLKSEAWEIWKRKLGGKQAEFIQAFLDHGEMTQIQLKIATHSGTSTVPLILDKLQKLGLVSKNGGKYALKEL